MSWVTIIWTMTSAACLTLAAIYLLIWCRRRSAWADLFFTVTSVGVAAYALCELAMTLAETPAQFATALRWLQLPTWVVVVSLAGFVRFHLRAGRLWLAWSIFALRTLALLLNFVTGQNLNYREVTALRHIPFLGEPASLGVGVSNPWMLVGQLSLLLLVIFTLDATITVWRRGDRRQALVTGGSIVFFALTGMVQAVLVLWRMVDMPLTESFCFLGIVLVMGYEMSRDALRAAQLSDDLRESEQRMAMAAEAANLGVWVRDLVRNEIWASARWRSLFGFTATERLDLDKFLQRLHPDDREIFRQAVAKATRADGRYQTEFRVLLPDGRIRWMISRGRVEFNGGGKAVRVRGVSADITERKLAEEANRNADDLMAAVFNSIPGLLYLYNEDGRLVRWNRQHELMTGYTAAELLNFRIQDWFAEADQTKLAMEFSKVLVEGYTLVEMNLRLKNGEQVPHSFTGTKVIIDGKPYLVGIGINISERKKAQEKLRQSEERFHAVVEQASDGFELLDLDGRYLEVNAASLRQLGYTREEIYRLTVFDVVPSLDRDRFNLDIQKITGDKPLMFETLHRRKDGSTFPVEVTISTINIGDRRCLFALVRDITERKQAEAEALRQRAELAHLSRVTMLGELSGSMAHELNQPLTAILSNAQAAIRFLAHDHPDLDEVRDILKDIVEQDNRAGEVIRRLRLLLKKGEVQQLPLDLNDVVLEVLKLIRSDLVNQSVTAHTELATALPPVKGDRVQLQQVLLNLVMNACDAMHGNAAADRQLVLRTERTGDDSVRVSVADGGVGLTPDKLEQVFMPFYTTKPHGLGLSLSVCRTIITAHGGKLWATNGAERGAVFYFALPSAAEEYEL